LPPTPPTFQTAKCQEVMDKSRQVKNCESAKTSRDGQRQRLGDIEFKRRNAEAERARRKKKKEETELAQFAAEVELEEGENQQTQVPQAYQPAHQQARQQEQLAASVAAELQKLQKLQQEVVEAQAKLDAIKAAAAAAAAPPPPPPQPAPPPPPAAPTAQSPPAWKPLPADLTQLSDELGVSSAPNLLIGDVLKLTKVLDTCGDIARVDGALRRLQV
jgi:chemotaxis protein histidine kinase CheA